MIDMVIYNWILYFYVYGVLGWCTEVAYAAIKQGKFVNRGFLNGPICPIYGIGVGVVVQFLTPLRHQELLLYFASTILVTLIEGITGFILDKIFHHRWWDYSSRRFNIGGYVCLRFSLIWGATCVFIVKIFHPMVQKVLGWIPFYAGLFFCMILGIVMFADLYVTASAILKFNKRLESMEKIASELRDISDKMGENIYEGVVNGVEVREESKKRIEVATEESKKRIEAATEESKKRIEATAEAKRQQMESRRDMFLEKVEEAQNNIQERVENVQNNIQECIDEFQTNIQEKSEEAQSEMQTKLDKMQAESIERAEAAKKKREKLQERYQELQEKYSELAGRKNKITHRLMKAFPDMTAPGFEQALEKIREAMENHR